MKTKRAIAALGAAVALALSLPAQAETTTVYRFNLTGTVDPLLARGLERAVHKADREHRSLEIRIDTPGGLDSSMRKIIQAILASRSPIVCWVGPSGARAASAGAFILIGCPRAVMAPGTNVGAAHPVGITGGIISEKVTNDAAAFIRSLAQRWNRNADWAEKAVRDSVSVSAEEAENLKVIDDVVDLDNTRHSVTPTLGLAHRVTLGLSPGEALLHDLIDPNLAFLFFLFGIAGVVFEVLHPGISIPGLLGIILFVSSLVMLGMLPVNVAGLVLLVAAMIFFVVDLKVAAHGLPTAAGIACLVLGGLFLYNSSVPKAHVSRPLIIGTAIAMAAFFSLVVRAALTARRKPKEQPLDRLQGKEGVVQREGIVRALGESWTAEPATIPAGTRVRITGVRGLVVLVEPIGAPVQGPGRT